MSRARVFMLLNIVFIMHMEICARHNFGECCNAFQLYKIYNLGWNCIFRMWNFIQCLFLASCTECCCLCARATHIDSVSLRCSFYFYFIASHKMCRLVFRNKTLALKFTLKLSIMKFSHPPFRLVFISHTAFWGRRWCLSNADGVREW